MPREAKVLIIDDETALVGDPKLFLGECGYDVEIVSTGGEGLERLRRRAFDVVLTELRLPDTDGFDILRQVLAFDAEAVVIVLTDRGSVRLAVEAVKAGAFYFVAKPVEPERLRLLVERALDRRALSADARRLRDVLRVEDRYGDIVGRSKPMQDMYAVIEAVATSDANVLIVGESGTGKELVASAIHARSLRARHAFVKINCSALPRELVENELFGHVRGAYTGAEHDKKGLVGSASGGSLLLDEIGEMPVELQPKLLRVLQERQYNQLGSGKQFKADFRLIASTNQEPEEAIATGRLREDFYYRISTITIRVPPLRERREDVALLADRMLRRYCAKYHRQIAGFSPAAYAAMFAYDWPGNVRELENAIERAVLLTHGSRVGVDVLSHLAPSRAATDAPRTEEVPTIDLPSTELSIASNDRRLAADADFSIPAGMTLADVERSVIFQTLRHLGGNKAAAAAVLGIYRPRLYAKIRHYNLKEFAPRE